MTIKTIRKNLKNYRTEIKADKSIAEIQSILAAKGAQSIMVEYENGNPAGLMFSLSTPQGQMSVKLPARIENVRKIVGNGYLGKNADNIAWRNIKDWIDAQIALIETEMVTMREVFMPYMLTSDKMTLFERFERGQLALGTGNKQ